MRVCFRHARPRKLAAMEPTQLSRQALDDFKEIYHAEFDVLLSDAEVQEIALRLLHFFEILAKPSGDKKE